MGVAPHFTWLDWGVIVAYMALTTYIGHRLKGRQATIRDFFLGGRTLPWPAVCGSIIATEISALTFIGVPAMVFAMGGNFTYLQWAIGSVLARVLVGKYFVKLFYEREIFSPYDYMENRLGRKVHTLTTLLFMLGAILGQSVRVLVTALILRVVTDLPFEWCIVIIGVVAILWTIMGGMTTVIWTDVMQFFLFLGGGLLAVIVILLKLDGGWDAFVATAGDAGKFKLIDLSTDPAVGFTLWVGILAMPFQNLAAFGTDQMNAQRMFCCRNARDAGKAMIWSSCSQVVTILMLTVGALLYVYYQQHPPDAATAALLHEDQEYVFPIWITTVLPPGITGLVIGAAFAAAISSLDSVLAALSQTTLSLFYKLDDVTEADEKKMLWKSRMSVVAWGVALSGMAILLSHLRDEVNLIDLAFGMVSYTYGPMLGIFLLAVLPTRRSARGLLIGVPLSILVVLFVRPDLYRILEYVSLMTPEQVALWKPKISYAWLYPITCGITLGCGILFGRRKG